MSQEHLEDSLEGIRQLLSHLQGEITTLERCYSQVLLALRRLESSAAIDDLTGLLRRNAFFSRWRELLEECRRLGEGCGLLMIDIDFFKCINDTHGHPTGDEVLRNVAALLRRFEAPGVFAGRYGGEEFTVAVRGSDEEVRGLAERIRREAEALEGPVIGEDGAPTCEHQWRCTLSVGVASAEGASYDPARMLAAADLALLKAKRQGRNQVRAA